MQFLFKALVLPLLVAVIAAPLVALGLTPEFSLDQRLAGCHQHSAPVPQPGPASHSCCQGGHYPAIVQQGSTVRPQLRSGAQVVFLPNSLACTKLASSPNLMIVCDPPIISPLRV